MYGRISGRGGSVEVRRKILLLSEHRGGVTEWEEMDVSEIEAYWAAWCEILSYRQEQQQKAYDRAKRKKR